jgi:hypothetical protein
MTEKRSEVYVACYSDKKQIIMVIIGSGDQATNSIIPDLKIIPAVGFDTERMTDGFSKDRIFIRIL